MLDIGLWMGTGSCTIYMALLTHAVVLYCPVAIAIVLYVACMSLVLSFTLYCTITLWLLNQGGERYRRNTEYILEQLSFLL